MSNNTLSCHAAVLFLMGVVDDNTYADEVRIGAIIGLGHAGGTTARAFLAKVVGSNSYGNAMRTEAAVALGRAAKDD